MTILTDQINRIKSAPNLQLKPNPYLRDPDYPYKYQRRGSLMMLLRPRLILGDDVGLGKTIESIVSSTYMKAKRPDTKFLVMTEKGALEQWQNEYETHTKDMKPIIITAETHVDSLRRMTALRLGEYDVLITTYSLAYDYSQYMLEGLGERWVIFADEPNYFKTVDSMLHRNMYGFVNGDLHGNNYRMERRKKPDGKYEILQHTIPGKPASRAYGLTATIIENRLEEAFGIMRVITPGCFPSKKYFEDNFCKMGRRKGVKAKVVVGYKNLPQFRRHIEPYFYGRLQDDPEVEQELPTVIFKDLDITLPDPQGRKLLEATDKLFQYADGEIKQVDVLPSLILAQQIADDPRLIGFDIEGEKTRVLIEMLQNSLAGERVIIYSKFRSAIDLLEEQFKKHNVERPVRITGKETTAERNESKRRFMSDGLDRANILLGTRAMMKAMNLQKGGVLIFYDLPWSYGNYRQIIGRIKRTGSQHKTVLVIHLLAKLSANLQQLLGQTTTIDHHTLNTIRKKFDLWKIVTGDVIEIDSVTSDFQDVFNAIRSSRKTP